MTDPRHALGELGEHLAAQHLEAHGWTLLERNWTRRAGEIDIIAERGETIAFVEVRTISSTSRQHTPPELTVTPRKQRKLIKTARQWLSGKDLPRHIFRFDIIAIVVFKHDNTHTLTHFESAHGWS